MARSNDTYIINVHYPVEEEATYKMKKRAGVAYIQFVKEYILTLSISDEEKNRLYLKVMEHLFKKYDSV